MQGKFIKSILDQCQNQQDVQCYDGSGTIDTKCLLQLTNDCFQRMKSNLKNRLSGQQYGGGTRALDSIVPYFLAHGIYQITRSTKAPYGLINDDNEQQFDVLVRIGEYLSSDEIKAINSILNSRPSKYQ